MKTPRELSTDCINATLDRFADEADDSYTQWINSRLHNGQKLRATRTELKNEVDLLRSENKRLREALIPIAEVSAYYGPGYKDYDSGLVSVGTLRRASAALNGGE